MKSNQNFNTLDEISFDQAIFSDKLYRKICNLDNTYSVFCLELKNNSFIWEKINNFQLPENYECVSFNNLVYAKDNNNHITIYYHEGGNATKLMIYTGNNMLIWDILNIPFNVNNLHSHSLLNFPTHINLMNEYSEECQTDTYDLLDEFEPLHGWDNLLERSSDTEEKISLDNDLDVNIEIKDNFTYPENEYHTDMKLNDVKDNHSDEECDYESSVEDDYAEEDYAETDYSEYRRDPYDGELYNYREFVDFYGGEAEWNFMDHKKVLLREEYYKFTNTFCHLSDKKFMYLFNEFKKTY